MTEKFSSWEQYFNRDYREYSNWLRDLAEEELEMIIIDLIKLSQNQQVIVDIHLDPGLAKLVTDYKRVMFLVAPPDKVLRDYYDRDGHREIYDCIMRLDNPKKALENVNKMLKYTTEKTLKSIYDSGLYYHIRNDRISKEARLSLVEQHFELNKKNISICRKKTTL